MMDYDIFKYLKGEEKKDKREERESAHEDFNNAKSLASKHGLFLTRCSDTQYNLSHKETGALWQLYPGNKRIYTPKTKRSVTPFLKINSYWKIFDVVVAAIEALNLK